MSGRKPARTDYVYVVTPKDSSAWMTGLKVEARRTLKAAIKLAGRGMTQPLPATRIVPGVWLVQSALVPAVASEIVRVPLGR